MWSVSGDRRPPDSAPPRQAGVDSLAGSAPRADRSSALAHDVAHVVPQPSHGRSATEIEADAIADRVVQPDASRQTSASLGPVLESVRAVTGVDIGNTRLHDAPHLTRTLRVQAFTRGSDIFTGGRASGRVLAHEAAHVAQQVGRGVRRVDGWSDPTISTLTAPEVAGWTDAQVREGLALILDQIAPVNRSVPEGDPDTEHENLRLLVVAAITRQIGISDDLLARLPVLYGPPTANVAEILARIDFLGAMLNVGFPTEAKTVAGRLNDYRQLLPWLDTPGLQQARSDVDASAVAVETAARIHRLAVDPGGGNASFSASVVAVNGAITRMIRGILTPQLSTLVADVETARDAWLEQIADSFARTINEVSQKISTPIDPEGYGKFSTGLRYNAVRPQRDTIADLESERDTVTAGLGKLVTDHPSPSAPLEERLGYVVTKGPLLDDLCARAENILMGVALCEQGEVLAEAMWETEGDFKSVTVMTKLSAALFNLVRRGHGAADRAEVRRQAEEAFAGAGDRADTLRFAQRMVVWIANIGATLLGIGAMRAVMAVPAIAGLGRTGATIIGSLAFTGTRLAITANQGRPVTLGGLLEDAAKDYLLLRLLGGVDARIAARVGDTGLLAGAARLGGTYGTLVGWTLTWNALQPGTPGPTGAKTASTGEVLVHTGVDLALFMIAEALVRAPVLPAGETTIQRDAAASKQARLEWESLRKQLQAGGEALRKWLNGPRDNVAAGDKSIVGVVELLGRTKGLHARFAELGEITAAQRAQLDGHADAMLETVRNARDEVRMDVRSAGPESWSYRGSAENIAAYLERLRTQGRLTEVTPAGNNIFSVRDSDGTIQWFFPAGTGPPVVFDAVADAVKVSAPDVPDVIRGKAITHLRGAKWGDLGTFAGSLRPGRGSGFVGWAARADAGRALADNKLPMPVVRVLAEGPPQQLAPIARGDATVLPEWYRQWSSVHPDKPAQEFVTAMTDMIAWRGSLEGLSTWEIGSVMSRREYAIVPHELALTPPAASMGVPGAKTSVYTPDILGQLKNEAVAGAQYHDAMRYDAHFVVEIVDGRIARLFEIKPDGTIVRRVPVAEHLATLRDILGKVEATRDEASARTELARSDPLLKDLDALLDFREGVPANDIHLMDALAHHPLRNPSGPARPAFEPTAKPRKPSEIMSALSDFGLEPHEIVSFGGEDASTLGTRSAGRVARLGEHFTPADLKALGKFLWESDLVLSDAMVDALIGKVAPGRLPSALKHIEIALEHAAATETAFDMEGALGVTETAPRSPRDDAGDFRREPAWRVAERELGPVLEAMFGPGWVTGRIQAPGARPGETLGSTVPEYYRPDPSGQGGRSFEVKRFDVAELGIDPDGQVTGTPSQRSTDALARARRQVEGRRWGMSGYEQNIVFNVTGQGIRDVAAVGRQLQALLESSMVRYDNVYVQNGNQLVQIQ
ncbi:eCIS core domain-containing protein [Mycobacterium sp. NPDC004974]